MLCKQLNVVFLTFQYMAPKIKPIRRDSNDVNAMLIPWRLELLMKPSASSVIADVLVREDRFMAENYLQGNTISKSTFMHHLHNSFLNSRRDTSKYCVQEMHFIQNLTETFLTTKMLLPFLQLFCLIVPRLIILLSFVEHFLLPLLKSFGYISF